MGWGARDIVRIALNICPYCNKEEALSGLQWCGSCRESITSRRRSLYRAKVKRGESPVTNAKKVRDVGHKRTIRAERKSLGLCIDCGGSVKKYKRCNRCRNLAATANRRMRERQRKIG